MGDLLPVSLFPQATSRSHDAVACENKRYEAEPMAVLLGLSRCVFWLVLEKVRPRRGKEISIAPRTHFCLKNFNPHRLELASFNMKDFL